MSTSLYPEGNQPLAGDDVYKLLQKIAASLYNITGNGNPPNWDDSEWELFQRIAGYVNPAAVLPSGTGYRVVGGVLQIYNPDTGLYYPLQVTGSVGFERLALGGGTP